MGTGFKMAPGPPQLEVINSINTTQLQFLASAFSVSLSARQLSLFPLPFQTPERQHLIGSVDDPLSFCSAYCVRPCDRLLGSLWMSCSWVRCSCMAQSDVSAELAVFGRVDSNRSCYVEADMSCVNISHDTSFSRLW